MGYNPPRFWAVSIDEVAAMVIAGAMSDSDGVDVVWAQSQAVMQHCPEAAMLAILAPLSLFETYTQFKGTTLAAVNFDNHFIVSADLAKSANLERTLKAEGITYQCLPVRYGFHSPLIAPAAEDYLRILQSIRLDTPKLNYYSCAYGGDKRQLPYTHPWDAVVKPIALQQTLQQVNQMPPHHLIDVGPASTLATLAKYALPKDMPHQISGLLSPMGSELNQLEQLLSS